MEVESGCASQLESFRGKWESLGKPDCVCVCVCVRVRVRVCVHASAFSP